MEIFGGFMVMISILGLFLSVIWLIMPFVVFAIKGRQDRILEVLEAMDKRLAALESRLAAPEKERGEDEPASVVPEAIEQSSKGAESPPLQPGQ